MNIPQPKPFTQAIEAKFPETEAVPKDMQEWWMETRENLDRLKDKITTLESEVGSLKEQLISILERL